MSEQQKIVGEVELIPLRSVSPNYWNPNKMTERQRASLRHGLENDGWLASQSMLVWGSDEKGEKKNLIIDGEHRHAEATQLGFKQGPAVVLHGLTESQAKALTIKLDNKRGSFDDDALGALLRDIRSSFNTDMAVEFGFDDIDLASLLAEPPPPDPGKTRGASDQVQMVQITFTADQKKEWDAGIRELAAKFGTKNVTDTALAAMRSVK